MVERHIVDFILSQAELDPNEDIILEIGPGLGTISDELAKHSKRVYLVEMDNKCAAFLTENFQSQLPTHSFKRGDWNQDASDNEDARVIIIHDDFLKIPLPPANKVVANIPYQISAPILFKLLDNWTFSKAVLLVQKEFAKKLMTSVNAKNYSRITAATRLYLNVKKLRSVSATNFFPQPRVESMLIEITPKPALLNEGAEKEYRQAFLTFLRDIFPYKNKNFRRALQILRKNELQTPEFRKRILGIEGREEYAGILTTKLRALAPETLFRFCAFFNTGNYDFLEAINSPGQ